MNESKNAEKDELVEIVRHVHEVWQRDMKQAEKERLLVEDGELNHRLAKTGLVLNFHPVYCERAKRHNLPSAFMPRVELVSNNMAPLSFQDRLIRVFAKIAEKIDELVPNPAHNAALKKGFAAYLGTPKSDPAFQGYLPPDAALVLALCIDRLADIKAFVEEGRFPSAMEMMFDLGSDVAGTYLRSYGDVIQAHLRRSGHASGQDRNGRAPAENRRHDVDLLLKYVHHRKDGMNQKQACYALLDSGDEFLADCNGFKSVRAKLARFLEAIVDECHNRGFPVAIGHLRLSVKPETLEQALCDYYRITGENGCR